MQSEVKLVTRPLVENYVLIGRLEKICNRVEQVEELLTEVSNSYKVFTKLLPQKTAELCGLETEAYIQQENEVTLQHLEKKKYTHSGEFSAEQFLVMNWMKQINSLQLKHGREDKKR